MATNQQPESEPIERRAPRQRSEANRRNASIGKAVAVLRAAARHPDGASVSLLARDAGIPRATALRMITALEAEGLLLRLEQQDRVLLGTGLLELAAVVRPERLLVEAAREALAELARATEETATLAVRHGDAIIGVDEARGGHVIGPATWVGRTWGLDRTASGRIARGEVAEGEIAASVDELELGLASIAARIPLPGGTEAYITLSGPSFRFGPAARAAAAAPLLAAVAEVGRRMGAGPAHR